MQDTAVRLKEIRKTRGFSQKAFSSSLKIPLRTYQAYENGEHPFSEELLQRLIEIGINIHWLLTGDGKMDGPLQEELARIEALVNYWQANYQLLEANINRARAVIKERYGEGVATELCDEVLPKIEVSVQFPHQTGKAEGLVAVAEKSKEVK